MKNVRMAVNNTGIDEGVTDQFIAEISQLKLPSVATTIVLIPGSILVPMLHLAGCEIFFSFFLVHGRKSVEDSYGIFVKFGYNFLHFRAHFLEWLVISSFPLWMNCKSIKTRSIYILLSTKMSARERDERKQKKIRSFNLRCIYLTN